MLSSLASERRTQPFCYERKDTSLGVLRSSGGVVLRQALLLLDGEDVIKLLKLSSKARQTVEAAARLHGPVVSSSSIRLFF